MENKNHMVISIYTEKASDKNQDLLMMKKKNKIIHKLGIQETFHEITKAMYHKSTPNIKLDKGALRGGTSG